MTPPRILGVLISGSGSNLQAILDRVADGGLPCAIGVVISNDAQAKGLARAAAAGVPTVVVEHRGFASREDFERALTAELERAGVELVVLAGFMRVLSPFFVRRWAGRLVNIHPALLPSFPGIHAQRQAFQYGVRFTGCTVHFVDEGTDTGPIIVQAVVPVLPDDDEESLAARILAEEHRIYPQAIRWIAEGRVRIVGRAVQVDGAALAQARASHNPPLEPGLAAGARGALLEESP
ncbi:MAG: phosphoribosylglycinamide formyltransferase [bacterium]